MRKIRAAILGQGRSGRDIHSHTLRHLPEHYEIVAVADELGERRSRAERELNCASYEDYRALFGRQDIDLVVNALPSYLHVPVSREFLDKGFNVLCEKPLGRRVEEVDALLEASARGGGKLAVFQQSRFSPSFQKIQEVIASGVLGRVVQASVAFNGFSRRWDWQTLKAMNGGNLLNTGPHPVDQALQLFGTDRAPSVLCRMDSANSSGDAEDYVKLVLYGEGRPTIDVEISSCSAYPLFTYHVQGTRGGLMGDTSSLRWKYYRPEEAPEQSLIRTPLHKADGTPAYCGETLQWHEERWSVSEEQGRDLFHSMAGTFYGMLYDSLVGGAPLKVTVQEVRQQIAVMEECFRQNPRFAL